MHGLGILMITEFAAGVCLAIWIYLLFARGGFWRLRERAAHIREAPASTASVAVIIPARNEAPLVGQGVRSLLEQNYAGPLHIFLVDDDSSDATVEVARRSAAAVGAPERLTIVSARPLPPGWTGKVWALAEGLRAAESFSAEYFLLTDADIEHGPEAIAEMVARAENGGYALVSRMATLSCSSTAERALIPAFVFFFFMLYPPDWVARRDRRTAAAAGGCMLMRAEALKRIGGIAAIRGELIDDCALARAVKPAGNLWLGLAEDTRSLRLYGGWREIESMISRTAFTQLRHSALLLAGTLAAMALTFLGPPLLLAAGGWPALAGGCAWLLMTVPYLRMLRFYRCSPLWAPLLPLIATFYMAATAHSAVRYWRGRGGLWKGRVQDSVLRSTNH
jgi:hopene-associated glycosyltransferase HpnB